MAGNIYHFSLAGSKSHQMKFIASLVLIMLISFTASIYFPWWIIAIASFVVSAIIPQTALMSFISGFVALFLLWGLLSFIASYQNDHILAHKISMLILKTDSPYLLMLVSAFTGALVAGFAGAAGSSLRKLASVKKG